MKTIVYQSYRTQQVPPWITTCMGTVRAWADQQGFDYRFYDDGFFEYAPQWFRDKAQHGICPVTDLARLVVARELLAQGYERTVWVDADLLVFAPEQLRLDLDAGLHVLPRALGLGRRRRCPATDAPGQQFHHRVLRRQYPPGFLHRRLPAYRQAPAADRQARCGHQVPVRAAQRPALSPAGERRHGQSRR
jgi:hypothetical protein